MYTVLNAVSKFESKSSWVLESDIICKKNLDCCMHDITYRNNRIQKSGTDFPSLVKNILKSNYILFALTRG